MSVDRRSQQNSAHRRAFVHYLRTGQRLTNAEWSARFERKFNPYHDELGRFTSPPGVTVSWGSQTSQQHGDPKPAVRSSSSSRPIDRRSSVSARVPAASPKLPASGPDPATGMRSEFVRERTTEGSYADTYFELNKRQAGLNRLREAAGSNPSAEIRADLDEAQARLDANRVLLAERAKVADRETLAAFRAVNPLIDVGAASLHIAKGEGDLNDAITLVTNLPLLKTTKLVGGGLAATLGRGARLAKPFATSKVTKDTVHTVINGTIQRGGPHKFVRSIDGYEAHHIPGDAVMPIRLGDGPTIAMIKADHRTLVSSKGGPAAREFRERQAAYLARGDYKAAIDMDVAHIRETFGQKYDDAIEQMLSYCHSRGLIK